MFFSTASRKGSFLFFLFSLLSSLLLFSSETSTALAAPAPVPVPIPDIDDGTLVTRANNIPDKAEVEKLIKPENLHEFNKYAKKGQPPKDKAVYFTGQEQKIINSLVEWAGNQHLTTVRNMWKSDNFFQKGQYKDVDAGTFRSYQKAFSKYYAQLTEGKAYLVFPHDKKPSKSGIFWSVELEEIIKHGKVEEIVWIDQKKIDDKSYKWNEEKKTYWKKGEKKPEGA